MRLSRLTLTTYFALGCVSALAEAPHKPVLEEVVVTSTRQEEALQRVPISVSILSNDYISQLDLHNLEEAAASIPNIQMLNDAGGTQLFIRGIGSGINFGFEQSVGTFIDNVYYGRGRSTRSAFLDIERVEILKGPQSTLFGKNTIAGAINISTAQPTAITEGYVNSAYTSEINGKQITAVVNNPISPNFRARVAGLFYEDQGYVENTAPNGEDGPQQEEGIGRLSLAWNATEDIEFTLKGEAGRYKVIGRNDMISLANPEATAIYQLYGDSNFEADFDYKKTSRDLPNRPQEDVTQTRNLQLTSVIKLPNGTLRSITAYQGYDAEHIMDADYGPIPFLDRERHEDHRQFSQEFLLNGRLSQSVDYFAGAYFQQGKLDSHQTTKFMLSSIPLVESRLVALTRLAPGVMDADNVTYFDQDSQSYSAFASLTWRPVDKVQTELGVRYSHEHKEVSKSSIVAAPGETVTDPERAFALSSFNPISPLRTPPFSLALANEYSYQKERSEEHWTGHLNLQYIPSDQHMLYLKLSNGFKAGGFDEDNALGLEESAEFEDETVHAVELGSKSALADNRVRFNVAWFYSEYKDIQASTFDGNCCFIVGNAAKSETQGVELDIEIALSQAFTLSSAIAYLEAEYKMFPNAACNEDQVLAWQADSVNNPFGSRAGCKQDLSGKPLQYAPHWAANMRLDYQTFVANNSDFRLGIEAVYTDDFNIANDQDEFLKQDSYTKYNAYSRLTFAAWAFSLIGKNLSNEKTSNWGNDVPLASIGFSKTYYQFIEPPRTIEFQVAYHF